MPGHLDWPDGWKPHQEKAMQGAMLTCMCVCGGVSGERDPWWLGSRVSGPCRVQWLTPPLPRSPGFEPQVSSWPTEVEPGAGLIASWPTCRTPMPGAEPFSLCLPPLAQAVDWSPARTRRALRALDELSQ